jgi:outer membrane protein assembly factor BamB
MARSRLFVLSLLALGFVSPLAADNWPHWRGPERTGVSTESDLPLSWSAEENLVWKLALPGGRGATPIVWGDRIFLNVADGGRIYLWCVDRTSGELLWKRELASRDEKKRKGNMSSPSPVTDGEFVWVMTGTGVLTAFDFSGKQLWSRDLQKDYGTFGILHGYSSSPLLDGLALYVQVLHGFYTDDPSYVLRLDALTGETRWRVDRPTDAPREAPDAYTTPALLTRGDRTELVVSGADYVTGHDLETGAELWRLGGLNPTANPAQRIVASPTVVDDMIFVPSRVAPMLALAASGDGPPTVAWSTDEGPDVPTPAITDDHVFILRDRGIMFCHDRQTGEVLWGPERVETAVYSASPIVADGRVYVTSETGTTTVIEAGPQFRVLAENVVDEYTLSSLAVADGQIFLRTADHLYCFAKPSAPAEAG